MAPPRFRGDSDDWMDDEEVTAGAKGSGPRKKVAKAVFLASEQANATVSEVYPKQCRVRLDGSALPPEEFLCSYRRAGVVGQVDQEYRERTPVAVGDRVLADRHSPDSGVIEGLCERSNRLLRPAPGREGRKMIHVLAANVDIVAIIAPVREPEFSPGLIDRFLIAAAASQPRAIEPILCINKVDLLGSGDPRPWEIYRSLGYRVFEVSSRAGTGLAPLAEALRDKTVVFCGRSGAGKTSLLRNLLGDEIGRVAAVSASTGKGMHTTTSAVLLGGPGQSRWIDTPGVREFGLSEVAPEGLADFYPELRGLRCSQASCMHDGEAGCGAEGLPRYESYRRMLQSLRDGEN